MDAKLDNSSYRLKVSLRQVALQLVDGIPVIIETHGGMGRIYEAIYNHVEDGVVFESESDKCAYLAEQRPSWAVYQADSSQALLHGAGSHLVCNYLDVDPYGECWPTINGYFSSDREFSKRMVVVVNDGLRHQLQLGIGWRTKSLDGVVGKYGNNLWGIYLDVCRELLDNACSQQGYMIMNFRGYYTGRSSKLTHFVALLEK